MFAYRNEMTCSHTPFVFIFLQLEGAYIHVFMGCKDPFHNRAQQNGELKRDILPDMMKKRFHIKRKTSDI